jgi:hypothetical protein
MIAMRSIPPAIGLVAAIIFSVPFGDRVMLMLSGLIGEGNAEPMSFSVRRRRMSRISYGVDEFA